MFRLPILTYDNEENKEEHKEENKEEHKEEHKETIEKEHKIEETGKKLRDMMSWMKDTKLVDEKIK